MFRILDYTGGGQHDMFSDETDIYQADYFSGCDEVFLQGELDDCGNYLEAANPDTWCEDFLTFRVHRRKQEMMRRNIVLSINQSSLTNI